MMWPFKRKNTRTPKPTSSLSREEAAYRKERIEELSFRTGKSLQDSAQFMDQWLIHKVQHSSGGEEPVEGFVPHPIWDDEWMMTRDPFDSYEDAEAEVSRNNGRLIFTGVES